MLVHGQRPQAVDPGLDPEVQLDAVRRPALGEHRLAVELEADLGDAGTGGQRLDPQLAGDQTRAAATGCGSSGRPSRARRWPRASAARSRRPACGRRGCRSGAAAATADGRRARVDRRHLDLPLLAEVALARRVLDLEDQRVAPRPQVALEDDRDLRRRRLALRQGEAVAEVLEELVLEQHLAVHQEAVERLGSAVELLGRDGVARHRDQPLHHGAAAEAAGEGEVEPRREGGGALGHVGRVGGEGREPLLARVGDEVGWSLHAFPVERLGEPRGDVLAARADLGDGGEPALRVLDLRAPAGRARAASRSRRRGTRGGRAPWARPPWRRRRG